jgi:hypothetical protein
MRIGFALVRKEAEYFRSKGLYKEARDLYTGYTANWATIDPDIKAAIEKELKLIESEMSSSQAIATPEYSGDRGGLISNSFDESAPETESLSRFCSHDPSIASAGDLAGRNKVDNPDWLDGMADIYALVANTPDPISSKHLEAEVSNAAEQPKVLPVLHPHKKSRIQRSSGFKFYLIGIAAVATLAVYFAGRFFSSTGDPNLQVAQPPAAVVYKKVPTGNEAVSSSPGNRPEESAGNQLGQETEGGETQAPSGPDETMEIESSSLPASKDSPAGATGYSEIPVVENRNLPSLPEEPDPASAIDFVLKKRQASP